MTDLSTPSHPPATEAERRAQKAFDLVHSDPSSAEDGLRDVIMDPSASDRAGMVARWGLGRLLHDQGAIADAGPVYAEAVRLAEAVAERAEEALIRVSWSLCLQAAGDSEAALAQLGLAEPALDGARLGRLLMQRGSVFLLSGAADAAVDEYDEALPLLQAEGDHLAQARLAHVLAQLVEQPVAFVGEIDPVHAPVGRSRRWVTRPAVSIRLRWCVSVGPSMPSASAS